MYMGLSPKPRLYRMIALVREEDITVKSVPAGGSARRRRPRHNQFVVGWTGRVTTARLGCFASNQHMISYIMLELSLRKQPRLALRRTVALERRLHWMPIRASVLCRHNGLT